jgi:hypothetical protein
MSSSLEETKAAYMARMMKIYDDHTEVDSLKKQVLDLKKENGMLKEQVKKINHYFNAAIMYNNKWTLDMYESKLTTDNSVRPLRNVYGSLPGADMNFPKTHNEIMNELDDDRLKKMEIFYQVQFPGIDIYARRSSFQAYINGM